jgi:hypothetical protein
VRIISYVVYVSSIAFLATGKDQYCGRLTVGTITEMWSSLSYTRFIRCILKMNLMAMTSRFGLVATLGVLCAFTVVAGTIPVANFSFETIPVGGRGGGCGTGCFFSAGPAAIPNWLGSDSTSGEFQPGTQLGNTTKFSVLSDGITSAYSNGATLSQTVATVVAGFTYTLMVDLGERNDIPTFMGSADLLINGKHYLAIGNAPLAGHWSTFTATYLGTVLDSGQPITIELFSPGAQANFDNVRLSGGFTPEPAGVTLLGLGLAGLLIFGRRRRAS